MRKIIASQYLSLDGVLEDPVGMEDSGLGDWTGPFSRGPKGDAFKHEELSTARRFYWGDAHMTALRPFGRTSKMKPALQNASMQCRNTSCRQR
jgi:hypothetical protein